MISAVRPRRPTGDHDATVSVWPFSGGTCEGDLGASGSVRQVLENGRLLARGPVSVTTTRHRGTIDVIPRFGDGVGNGPGRQETPIFPSRLCWLAVVCPDVETTAFLGERRDRWLCSSNAAFGALTRGCWLTRRLLGGWRNIKQFCNLQLTGAAIDRYP